MKPETRTKVVDFLIGAYITANIVYLGVLAFKNN